MIPNLLESLQIFFETHKLNKFVIVQRHIYLNKNGDEKGTFNLNDSMAFSKKIQAVPLTIQIITAFSILDSWIDTNIDEIKMGSNFFTRYKKLPSSCDKEIIIKETYRIFRNLRNTVIHNNNNINIINDNVINFNGITIKINTLYYLYSLVCELFSNNRSIYFSDRYHIGVLRYYYDKIIKDLYEVDYCDDIGKSFLSISDDVIISVTVRYTIQNPNYEIIENILKIKKYKCQFDYKADYRVIYKGKEYFIPDETLDTDGRIELFKLPDWECFEN